MALGADVTVATGTVAVGEKVGKGVLVAGASVVVEVIAAAAGGLAVSVESAGVGAGFVRLHAEKARLKASTIGTINLRDMRLPSFCKRLVP